MGDKAIKNEGNPPPKFDTRGIQIVVDGVVFIIRGTTKMCNDIEAGPNPLIDKSRAP